MSHYVIMKSHIQTPLPAMRRWGFHQSEKISTKLKEQLKTKT